MKQINFQTTFLKLPSKFRNSLSTKKIIKKISETHHRRPNRGLFKTLAPFESSKFDG